MCVWGESNMRLLSAFRWGWGSKCGPTNKYSWLQEGWELIMTVFRGRDGNFIDVSEPSWIVWLNLASLSDGISRAGRVGICLCSAGGWTVPLCQTSLLVSQTIQTGHSSPSGSQRYRMKQELEDNLNNYFTDQGCCTKCSKNQTVWETFRSEEPWGLHLSALPEKDGEEIHLLDASLQLKAPGTHSF